METKEKLKSDFLKLNLKKAYFFYGEDSMLKNELVSIISKSQDYRENHFDFIKLETDPKNISQVFYDCDSPPLSASKKIVVLKRAEKLKTADLKELLNFAKSLADFAVLIILYDKPLKKNDPLFEELDENGLKYCAFDENSFYEAVALIKERFSEREIKISEEDSSLLFSIVGGRSDRLSSEIEKISLYLKEKKEVSKEDILACVSLEKETNPYEISQAIMTKNPQRLKELVNSLLKSNEEPIVILNSLTSAVDKLLKAGTLQECAMSNDFKACYSLGVFYGEMKDFQKHRPRTDNALKILSKCLEAENALKTSAEINPDILIKSITYELAKVL